ncbi:MAG: hypothetical protein ACYC6C_04245 [Coriobacteriia bacterium]
MTPDKAITVSDERHDIPFSKGLMAQSFTSIGVSPSKAYGIAIAIQQDLRDRDELSVSMQRLRALATDALGRMAGEQYAVRYRKLYELSKLDRPLVVLIGGTTGVGKSTIATEVAHRLGITRIMSTDSIREVMRGIFTRDLMPAIYESAFNAWRGLRVPVPHGANPVIVGFREQTAAVTTAVKSLIERSVLEGDSLVLEGVHLVPGYIGANQFRNARVVQLVIGVANEDVHRSHFYIREVQTDGVRPFERYRANFGNIRVLGSYIEDMAHEHGVRVLMSHQLDETIADVIEYIVNSAIEEEYDAHG